MSYIKEVFGFSGQVAILCSIVAAIICLVVIPQDIRQKIFLHIHISRRTIKFVIRAKLDNNREFIIQTHKRNEQKINRYFEGKYDKLYLKIVDFRKYSIIKNIIFNKHHFTSFFHKKVSYRIFLVYNEFAKTNTKESDPVR